MAVRQAPGAMWHRPGTSGCPAVGAADGGQRGPRTSSDRPFYEDNPFQPKVLVLEEPAHTISKNTVMAVLSGENLIEFERHFKAEAERVVDELLANGPVEIDAYGDLAAKYVLKVFPDVLGLPADGRELLSTGPGPVNTTMVSTRPVCCCSLSVNNVIRSCSSIWFRQLAKRANSPFARGSVTAMSSYLK